MRYGLVWLLLFAHDCFRRCIVIIRQVLFIICRGLTNVVIVNGRNIIIVIHIKRVVELLIAITRLISGHITDAIRI